MNIKDWGRRQEAGAGPASTPTWPPPPRGLRQARGHGIKGSWVPPPRGLGGKGCHEDLLLRVKVITSSASAGPRGWGESVLLCSGVGEGRAMLAWGAQAAADGGQAWECHQGLTPDHLVSFFLLLGRGPVAQAVGFRGFLGRRSAPSPDKAQQGYVRDQGKLKSLCTWHCGRLQRPSQRQMDTVLRELPGQPGDKTASPERSGYARGEAQRCWRRWVDS